MMTQKCPVNYAKSKSLRSCISIAILCTAVFIQFQADHQQLLVFADRVDVLSSTIESKSNSGSKKDDSFNKNINTSANGATKPDHLRLDCEPGEQRHFNYESSTKVWGSSQQQVELRANLRITCMESNSTGHLKYLVEVLALKPDYIIGPRPTGSGENSILNSKLRGRMSEHSWQVQAEPVLEEVGEAISIAATRVRRSVSGWLTKTWGSVRDFFVNIFSSSERSSVGRDEVLNQDGLDIASQCRASKGKWPPGGVLPIDDSMFDEADQFPHYYIGTSGQDPSLGAPAYDFGVPQGEVAPDVNVKASTQGGSTSSGDESAEDEDDNLANSLSFFDDPKPPRSQRSARSTSSGPVGLSSRLTKNTDLERLIKMPFEFVQTDLGRVLEIRFGDEDSDLSVRNFKRHLCDLFTTNLDLKKTQLVEQSPIGEHTTKYLLDQSNNSNRIKETLNETRASGRESVTGQDRNAEQAIKVLAMVVGRQNEDEPRYATGGLSCSANEPGHGSDCDNNDLDQPGDRKRLSVLRSINSTQVFDASSGESSKLLVPNLDALQVSIKQVQELDEGRMVGTFGHMGVSLLQGGESRPVGRARRQRRSNKANKDQPADQSSWPIETDIAELLEVSSSFSLNLAPISKLSLMSSTIGARLRRSNARPEVVEGRNSSSSSSQATKAPANRRHAKREPLVIKPSSDSLEEQRRAWRQLESRMQFSSSNLLPESSRQDNQVQRLELLRDQIQMRINEDFMRNKLRTSHRFPKSSASSEVTQASGRDATGSGPHVASKGSNELGMALTQLVLDSSSSSKLKGSLYVTLEEALDLELQLGEDLAEGSLSRLLKDTVKLDKLRSQCRLALKEPDDLAEPKESMKPQLSIREPFNVSLLEPLGALHESNRKRSTAGSEWREPLSQCKRVLGLLLRVGDRKSADLALELVDECNKRLLARLKREELGYGPASRHFRSLRQQFVEMLTQIQRPSEALLDKLLDRIDSLRPTAETKAPKSPGRDSRRGQSGDDQSEFVYVDTRLGESTNNEARSFRPKSDNYNWTLLRLEDDANNSDALGALIMSFSALASRDSVRAAKQSELAHRLLASLSTTRCSPFQGPDLDLLESLANFRSGDERLVSRIVNIARRCRHQDQYVVGCVHALAGQLRQPAAQRFLADQLRSKNVSCLVKSEILLTLTSSLVVDQYERKQRPKASEGAAGSELEELLLEIASSGEQHQVPNNERHRAVASDRRCLGQLIDQYFSLSSSLGPQASRRSRRARPNHSSRRVRSILNEDKFWDEAFCKRWTLAPNSTTDQSHTSASWPNSTILLRPPEGLDELDDNSIMSAIADFATGSSNKTSSQAGGNRLKLVEKESELSPATMLAARQVSLSQKQVPDQEERMPLRRRHKCSASKSFGPRNAQATIRAELVNELVGPRDENKFLSRFRLAANFLGQRLEVGRMYLWHQRRTTRALVNVLGKSLWDSSHSCANQAPRHVVYMPLFDFNLWIVKLSVGLRLQSEMGFFSNCQGISGDSSESPKKASRLTSGELSPTTSTSSSVGGKNPIADATSSNGISHSINDELELFPRISFRASGEAAAKLVVARAGMSLASNYGYSASIRVSRQPESCMSVDSSHQPMNVTFSSWFQLWDGDCHYWGSRNRAEPQATRWRLSSQRPTNWIKDECLAGS